MSKNAYTRSKKNTRNLFVVNKTSCYLKKFNSNSFSTNVNNFSPSVDTLSLET